MALVSLSQILTSGPRLGMPIFACLVWISCCVMAEEPGLSGTSPTDHDHVEVKVGGEWSPNKKALVVVCATVPSALVLGALWCYCMTAVCRLRPDKVARLIAPAARQGYASHRQIYRQRYSRSSSTPSLSSSGST